MRLELTIIGHWGGFPKAGEASSGYLLEHRGFKLLIDCGSAVLSKLQTFLRTEELDAAIISHYHADHIADIGVLQHALYVSKFTSHLEKCLPIYGHREDMKFNDLTYKDVTKGIAYHQDEQLHIGPFTISFLQTKHSVPCYAMRIEADEKVIVYTADTAYFFELSHIAKGADLLLSECNFYKGMDAAAAGHLTSEEAGIIAQQASVKQLILTHLPHFGNIAQLKEEASAQFKGNITIATEGLKVKI